MINKKYLISYKKFIEVSVYNTDNIIEVRWFSFSIPLHDFQALYKIIYDNIKKYSASKVLSDTSTATGNLSQEVLDFINTVMYPELYALGLKKIGVVIPVNNSTSMDTDKWEKYYKKSIEVKNFITPSEALNWLRNS